MRQYLVSCIQLSSLPDHWQQHLAVIYTSYMYTCKPDTHQAVGVVDTVPDMHLVLKVCPSLSVVLQIVQLFYHSLWQH